MKHILFLLALAVLTSCSSTQFNNVAPPADCAWSGTAHAWLDENGNGSIDRDEPSLSNVPFFVDDTLNDFKKTGLAISNLQGDAHLHVFLAGCPDAAFEVYPELPAGFKLTTRERISADYKSDRNSFLFGFTYLPGVPTATPRPSVRMTCIQYPLVGEHQYAPVSNIAVATDGTVWGSTLNGSFRFDPTNRSWKAYTAKDGLPNTYIESLSIAPDGEVWFATFDGVASFDGISWAIHRKRDSFNLGKEDVVAVTKSGVWLVTAKEASLLDMNTDKVITYPVEGDWRAHYINYATVTPDGTLWVANGDFVFILVLQEKSSSKWITYPIPYDYNHSRTLSLVGFAASSDGALWLAGTSSKGATAIRFDPVTEKWIGYDRSTTNGAILGESILSFAVAPDDTIWLATSGNGVIQLTLTKDAAARTARVVYHVEDMLVNSSISAIDFAPEGAVWFGATGSIIRCIEESN